MIFSPMATPHWLIASGSTRTEFDLVADNSDPAGIAVLNDKIYVGDRTDERIYCYSRGGHHLATYRANNPLPVSAGSSARGTIEDMARGGRFLIVLYGGTTERQGASATVSTNWGLSFLEEDAAGAGGGLIARGTIRFYTPLAASLVKRFRIASNAPAAGATHPRFNTYVYLGWDPTAQTHTAKRVVLDQASSDSVPTVSNARHNTETDNSPTSQAIEPATAWGAAPLNGMALAHDTNQDRNPRLVVCLPGGLRLTQRPYSGDGSSTGGEFVSVPAADYSAVLAASTLGLEGDSGDRLDIVANDAKVRTITLDPTAFV